MEMEMRMPDLATTGSPIKVLRWLVSVGQTVQRGQPLLEVETDKAVMQVESVISGCLSSVSAIEGEEVAAGNPIASFATDKPEVAPAARLPGKNPITTDTASDRSAVRDRTPAFTGQRVVLRGTVGLARNAASSPRPPDRFSSPGPSSSAFLSGW